jgi:prepilin-type processing-associated H-X9-DG protein
LLISALLPALNRARGQAMQVQCASNMRQIWTGMELYASMYQGWTLPAQGSAATSPALPAPSVNEQYNWWGTEMLGRAFGVKPRDYNSADPVDAGDAVRDALARTRKYFDCPALQKDTAAGGAAAAGYQWEGDYAYNTNLGDARAYTSPSNLLSRPAFIRRTKVPKHVLALLETRALVGGNEDRFSSTGDITRINQANPASDRPNAGNPHFGKTNMLFMDGSVRTANAYSSLVLLDGVSPSKNWMITRYTPNRGNIALPTYSFWFPGEPSRPVPF